MEKDIKRKGEEYSDRRILEEMERRKLEIDALKKILYAFDNSNNNKKTEVKPKES